jgi:hypothetical protein
MFTPSGETSTATSTCLQNRLAVNSAMLEF